MESPEYEAVVGCGRELQELISHNVRSLTPSLFTKRLISSDTEGRRLNSTGSDIASDILSNVRSAIKVEPSLFKDFLESLEEDSYYDHVRQLLQEKLSLAKTSKRNKSSISLGGSMESDFSVSRSDEDNPVFYESITDSVAAPIDCSFSRSVAIRSDEDMIIQVASHIDDVCKLRSLAVLMEMAGSDWEYIRTGGHIRKKRERLAELWVKKHRQDSLRLLAHLLTQPALDEKRIVKQISRSFSEASETGSIASASSVEVDGPANREETRRKQERMTKQDALNYLAGYPSLWEDIGKNLISSSEVDKIMNDGEAKGDEAAYIVERWWSATTEEDGGFSWEKLEEAIHKLQKNRNMSSHIIEDLEYELKQIYDEYCSDLENDPDNFKTFLGKIKSLPLKYKWIKDNLNIKELEDRNVRKLFNNEEYPLWNVIEHGFLGFLIRKCGGSIKLQDKMAAYEERVKEMCATKSIQDFIVEWDPPFDEDAIPEDISQNMMRLDWDPKIHTVSELQKIYIRTKARISQKVAIAAYVLVVIHSGSVTAIWLIYTADTLPHTSREMMELVKENPEFYASSGILLFMLKDFVIYPCTSQNLLWNASREGNKKELNDIICYNSEVDINHEYEKSKRTILHCAAKYGHVQIIDTLLEGGAEIDHCDAKGNTALMIALRCGKKDVGDILIWNGADLNIQDKVHATSALLIASERNYQNVVGSILSKKGNLGLRNKDNKTALILAAERGHSEVVAIIMEYLKKCSADIREVIMEQDINDCTALHAAAERGDVKIVQSLISYPEIIGITNKSNETALNIAARNGHKELVSLLEPSHFKSEMEKLEEEERTLTKEEKDKEEEGESSRSEETRDDNDPGGSADSQHTSAAERKHPNLLVKVFRSLRRKDDYKFVDAAEKGDIKTVEHFLKEKHHDPNIPKPDMQSWTALMWASVQGHVDVVKLLLKHGASPNIVAENGFSSLGLASREGHYEVVKALLDNEEKPDIHAVNQGGRWGALMWACHRKGSKSYSEEELKENHFKIAEALIAAGADINQEAENGWTPLMQASQDNNVKIVKMLCKMDGIKIDHKSRSTWSALTAACRKEREEVVKVLVDAGADVTLPKKGGVTALHVACYKGLMGAMKHMVPPSSVRGGSQIDVNVKDEWDMTPLMLAIKGGHKELSKYLIKEVRAEVNIQAMKYNQWSAIFFAIRNKDLDTYHLLVDHGANTEIKDEHKNTFMDVAGIAFSEMLSKKFYKQLEAAERKRLLEAAERKRLLEAGQSSGTTIPPPKTPALTSRFLYYPIEINWRTQQRPSLISN